ncbi:HAD family hydrolase [Pseudomaricurvus hydrocarbonicus]|uniref:histidinol-phosphatase n=1 Tax=Pseudomaricurvus hydrocarbonicus TaxID=1470433 RepID=UPI00312C6EA9
MRLAIFDLDNTLIAGDSDHGWGEFMVSEGMVDPVEYKRSNDQFYADYERGEMDLQAYLNFSLEPLTHYSLEELAQLHQKFMREVIDPMRLPQAEALLAKHRAEGDYLLIITSTNGFITKPIAASLGVDDILATDAEIINNRYSGKMTGTPCFQEGKITRLHQWLASAKSAGFEGDLSDCYFYSDSINDLPLMQVVDNPVAVDPDDNLRRHAEQQGWPVISLRDC